MKITFNHSYYDLFIWIFVYLLLVLLILFPIFSFSNGIVYPLDDVYIHLTMAKNLLQHGSWGLFPNENIAASSSPLFTILLAPFTFSSSVAMYAPLILNIVVSIGLLFLFRSKLLLMQLSTLIRTIIGTIFILFIPLPSLTVMGMEHLLHSLFVVGIIVVISNGTNKKLLVPILTAFSLFLRLETSFILFGIGIWCLFEKKWNILIQISIGFLLGLGLYFLLSIIFSINIIPNTILLKTIMNEQTFLNSTIQKVWNSKLLFFLSILSVVILIVQWNKSKMFLIVAITTISHLIFARQGWFYRYEAYIIVLFFVMFVLEFYKDKILRKKLITVLFPLAFLLICSKRAFLSMSTTHLASKNIYDQQFQTAMIIKLLPAETKVAVNDIGVVSYFNNEKQIIDLYGIATKDIFQMKKTETYTTSYIKKYLNQKNIDIVIVYTSWFDKEIFSEYTPFRTLNLQNNVVCGDSVVTFFKRKNSLLFTRNSFP